MALSIPVAGMAQEATSSSEAHDQTTPDSNSESVDGSGDAIGASSEPTALMEQDQESETRADQQHGGVAATTDEVSEGMKRDVAPKSPKMMNPSSRPRTVVIAGSGNVQATLGKLVNELGKSEVVALWGSAQEQDALVGQASPSSLLAWQKRFREAPPETQIQMLKLFSKSHDFQTAVVVQRNMVSVFHVPTQRFFQKEWALADSVVAQRLRIEKRTRFEIASASTDTLEADAGDKNTAAKNALASEKRTPAAEKEKGFLERTWPYWVAGILLAAAVTYVIVESQSGDDGRQGVLRIEFD